MEVMTVTKGLSELKLLAKRIERGTYQNEYVGYTIGRDNKVGHIEVKEFADKAKSGYQSVIDLIERRNAIKSAIVTSNSQTKVKVAGIEYTVAEAIERKNSIEFEEELLAQLKSQLARVVTMTDSINTKVKSRLDSALESMLEGESEKDNDFIEQYTDNFNSRNEARIIDPISIEKKIEELEESIENFLSEVDHELSVSNATTTIEIE